MAVFKGLRAGRAGLEKEPAAAARAPQPLLVFSLGEQAYGIPVADLQEVVPMAELSRPPGLPGVLAGFLNLAGRAVAVVRLDRLFGLPDRAPELYTPLLILRNPDCPLALLVEKVSRIVAVPPTALLPVPTNQAFNDAVEGMLPLDGRVVLVLSAERLLLEKEQQCLAELQDCEQMRLRGWEGVGP